MAFFVKPLRYVHSPLYREAQLSARLLLEGGRSEGGGWFPFQRAQFDFSNLESCPDAFLEKTFRVAFRGEALREFGPQRHCFALFVLYQKDGIYFKIGLRMEVLDFPFPLDDQFDGDRLHPSGGKFAAHFFPQDFREFIADEPVEYPSCLLGVDQVEIHRAGLLDRPSMAGLVISRKTMRLVVRGLRPSTSHRCQEMASPSRSSSVASHTSSTFFTHSLSSLTTLYFSGDTT